MERRRLVSIIAALFALALFAGSAVASPGAADLPSTWHVHDGQTALGSQHKGIGFFPVILGLSTDAYLADPAECPNATDKAFLPSVGSAESALLRAGMCFTSTQVIHLRTVPVGVDGPEGWSSLTTITEPGWVTYYLVTSR
jgi:hypothetical protein